MKYSEKNGKIKIELHYLEAMRRIEKGLHTKTAYGRISKYSSSDDACSG